MLSLNVGDTKPPLAATIARVNGTPVDLTGATVQLVYWPVSGGAPVYRSMTITDAPNGKVTYQWIADDTATAGRFRFYVKITFAGGAPLSAPSGTTDTFRVVDPFA